MPHNELEAAMHRSGAAAVESAELWGSILRKTEIDRGTAIADAEIMRHRLETEDYSPPPYLTLSRLKEPNSNYWNLMVKYGGPFSIEDRVIINEKINPSREILQMAQKEYHPMSFNDYMKTRGYCICDSSDCMAWCCCMSCYPIAWRVGYSDGYKKQVADGLLDITSEKFWRMKEEESYRKADKLVAGKIEESKKSTLPLFEARQQQANSRDFLVSRNSDKDVVFMHDLQRQKPTVSTMV